MTDEDITTTHEPDDEPKEHRDPVALDDMLYELAVEAESIRTHQDRLVENGLRTEPYQPYIRRAQIFEATHEMLLKLEPHLGEIRDLLKRKRKRRERGS